MYDHKKSVDRDLILILIEVITRWELISKELILEDDKIYCLVLVIYLNIITTILNQNQQKNIISVMLIS